MGKKDRGREAKADKKEKRSKTKGDSERSMQVGMAVCAGAIAVCVTPAVHQPLLHVSTLRPRHRFDGSVRGARPGCGEVRECAHMKRKIHRIAAAHTKRSL